MRIVGKVLLLTLAVAALSLTMERAPAQGSTLNSLEQLGREIFFDKIAEPDNQSCAACHAPDVGFTGGIPGINLGGSVYHGAVRQRFGNRKPPSAAYATQAPIFYYDSMEGIFVGGNFWDGRATGLRLGNPAADQALGPFLNPVEQNNPGMRSVLEQIAGSRYAPLWEEAWGSPISIATPGDVVFNYERVGLAIAAYEASSDVNAFSSKWDFFMRGEAELTPIEQQGMNLFNGKALCNACHPAPLFTDYTYDNLGTPKNLKNPFYDMDKVFLDDGSPINPMGADWVDHGLGGFLATLPESYFTGLGLDKAQTVMENIGKFKVPTLRNVDRRPSAKFPKAFAHNGFFTSLREIVRFYNDRDVSDWPEPEVAQNVNEDELGNLGLTDDEIDAVVAFLGTLSDGYRARGGHEKMAAAGRAVNMRGGILLTLPAAAAAEIRIFDVTGREIRSLGTQDLNEGANAVQWDGRDAGGWPAANGIYFYRIETRDNPMTVKAVLAR